MGGLLAAIAGLAAPMAARVLASLGFGVVTITGVALSADSLKELVMSHLSAGPGAALQIAGLAGVWVALGMIFGACSFCVSLFALTKAVRIAGL